MESGTRGEAAAMLVRLVDFLKSSGITAVFANLTSGAEAIDGKFVVL